MKRSQQKNKQILLSCFFAVYFAMTALAPLTCLAETTTLAEPEDNADCDRNTLQSQERANKWWEAPLDAVLDAATSVGTSTFTSVAGGAKRLMIAGGALWLAVFTLKVVGGMVESDPMENVTKVGGLIFRIGIAAALLKNSGFFFGYFFSPIIEAGAGFVGAGGGGGGGSSGAMSGANFGSGGLGDAAGALKGMATAIHNDIANLKGAGRYVQCLNRIHKFTSALLDFTFWDPGVYFSGCLIKTGAWIFIAVFPFFLIDAAFRMGITAALCPLFIVSWVFESTRGYASTGLKAVLNVAFVFMMVKLSASIAVQLLTAASGLDTEAQGPQLVCTYRAFYWGDVDPCTEAQNASSSEGSIFAFIICVAYGLLMMRQAAGELASHFSQANFSNDTAFQGAKGGAQAMLGAANAGVGVAQAVTSPFSAERRAERRQNRAERQERRAERRQHRQERRDERQEKRQERRAARQERRSSGGGFVSNMLEKTRVGRAINRVAEKVKDSPVGAVASRVRETAHDVKENLQDKREQVRERIQDVRDNIQDKREHVREKIQDVRDNIQDKLGK